MTFESITNSIDIYHDDILNALMQIPDGSVSLIFADPPYNIGKSYHSSDDSMPDYEYRVWFFQWLDMAIKKLADDGSIYIMSSTQFMPYVDLHVRESLHILARIVWAYDSSGVQATNYYGSLYEPILYAVKNRKKYVFNGDDIRIEAKTGAQRKLVDYRKNPPMPYSKTKIPGNVWDMSRVRFRMPEYVEHPTQKPEALLERIIRASSNPGDTVLDLFSGSFTTAVVANRLGRKSISIEMDQYYVEMGKERIRKELRMGRPL